MIKIQINIRRLPTKSTFRFSDVVNNLILPNYLLTNYALNHLETAEGHKQVFSHAAENKATQIHQ